MEPERLSFSSKNRKRPILVEVDGEEFLCTTIPGGVFMEFVQMTARPDPTDRVEKLRKEAEEAEALYTIFQSAMRDDEWHRFHKFITGPDGPDLMTLVEIMQSLVQTSSKFPTSPPSHSVSGRTATGDTSTDEPSSPASTSNPFHSTA